MTVDKAGIEINTCKDWTAARKTVELLRHEQTSISNVEGSKGKKTNYKDTVPSGRVKQIFSETVNDEKPFVHEFMTVVRSIKRVKFLVETRDLGIIEDYKLVELMEILDQTSDNINNHLTSKVRRGVRLT